jgi:hypothetical protein
VQLSDGAPAPCASVGGGAVDPEKPIEDTLSAIAASPFVIARRRRRVNQR